jgi:hypothetical protein
MKEIKQDKKVKFNKNSNLKKIFFEKKSNKYNIF